MQPFVLLENLEFSYADGKPVLQIPHFEIKRGDHMFLYGPSGTGKTTLLEILAGILAPQKGTWTVCREDLSKLSPAARDRFRADHLGYIFQNFNLIPYLTARENILLGFTLGLFNKAVNDVPRRLESMTKRLGIYEVLDKNVTQLSLGQQQRVALARALLPKPDLILADEPTSALDYDHRGKFLELLFEQLDEDGGTVLFVSHDQTLKPLFKIQQALGDLNKASTKGDI